VGQLRKGRYKAVQSGTERDGAGRAEKIETGGTGLKSLGKWGQGGTEQDGARLIGTGREIRDRLGETGTVLESWDRSG
jgi:hypothetical protein